MLSPKYCFFCLMAVFVAVATVPAVLASPASVAKLGIQAALARRNEARQHRDLNGYLATFTSDWVTTNVQGRRVTYAMLRKSMTASFARARTLEAAPVHYRITNIAAHGQTAEVTVKSQFDYPVRKTPSGLVYCSRNTTATQVWVKGATVWQLRQEHYLVDSIQFSAKPTPN